MMNASVLKKVLSTVVLTVSALALPLAVHGREWRDYRIAYRDVSWQPQLPVDADFNIIFKADFKSDMEVSRRLLPLTREVRFDLTAQEDCRVAIAFQDARGVNGETPEIRLTAGKSARLELDTAQARCENHTPAELPFKQVSLVVKHVKSPTVTLLINKVSVPRELAWIEPESKPVCDLSSVPYLVVSNDSTGNMDLLGECVVCAYDEKQVKLPVKLMVRPGSREKIKLPITDKTQGVWRVEWQLTDRNTRKSYSGVDRFARMIPNLPTTLFRDGFLFGIHAHLDTYPPFEREIMANAAAMCGADVIRMAIPWYIVYRDGVWNFDFLDGLQKLFAARNIEITPSLGTYCAADKVAKYWVPRQPNMAPKWIGWLPDREAWREFVGNIASHYKGKIRLWELWNEPDLAIFANFFAKDYLELLKIGNAEIKKIDPRATVISGGFAGIVDYKQLLGEVIASPDYDVFAIHVHGDYNSYCNIVGDLARLRKNDRRPWFSNETALSSVWGEFKQAKTLFSKMICAWANGSIGYVWYNLREHGLDPKNHEHHWGMITYDLKPKPVYVTFNTLTANFRGAKYIREFETGNRIVTHLFKAANGDWLLPFWPLNDGAANSIFAVNNIKSAQVELIDLMGNRHRITCQNGTVTVKSLSEPAILRIPAQSAEPEWGGSVLSVNGELVIAPGKSSKIEFLLRNPAEKSQVFQISGALPAGLHGEIQGKYALNAGRFREIAFSVNADREFTSLADHPKMLKMEVRSENSATALDFPLFTSIMIPASKLPDSPQFTLKELSQVAVLINFEPSVAHMIWKDAADLSAEVRLARLGDALLLQVKVTDDVHAQTYRGEQMWHGDSVQCALALPGQEAMWEFGFSRNADGKAEVFCFAAPEGFNAKTAAGRIRLATRRDEQNHQTTYEAEIPFDVIGLTNRIGRKGFRFNLLVNDNDGDRRESYIMIAPGLGSQKSTRSFPIVRFQ